MALRDRIQQLHAGQLAVLIVADAIAVWLLWWPAMDEAGNDAEILGVRLIGWALVAAALWVSWLWFGGRKRG